MSINDDIAKRAIRFAQTFHFANPIIMQTKPARDEFVARYGTPNSTEYRETEIHMDWGTSQQEIINASKLEERHNVVSLLKEGVDLLVVCSAKDVIHHEFLRMDLD